MSKYSVTEFMPVQISILKMWFPFHFIIVLVKIFSHFVLVQKTVQKETSVNLFFFSIYFKKSVNFSWSTGKNLFFILVPLIFGLDFHVRKWVCLFQNKLSETK